MSAADDVNGQSWYAVQAKPRREGLAIWHLERQGFAAYCPMIARGKLVRGKSVQVTEPLFPGYLFVGLTADRAQWRSVNGTIGVIRLVTTGADPAPVPVGFVERLRELEQSGGFAGFAEELQPGDEVRIVGGPFDDLCGELVKAAGSERVVVLLKLLSGETPVTLPRASLVAA
ncbi:hypothetical protein KUV75_14445 [Qipengyuania gaetbuli]|uniref:transcription termination/antitermination NusG family protein n=1 Tax=Qipengyuania gaetbuli TaxID=266952 RepID=UPI001C99BB60|nr:transcription termination/antitermination NusG family protein [Qipengyuania gaetbuli]MBY6016094.1 hypothetical protein [Qipengyuania gaetbuli]